MTDLAALRQAGQAEIEDLLNLDLRVQVSLSTDRQALELAVETIFLRLFKFFEKRLEDIFVLIVTGNVVVNGIAVGSYLRPKDTVHLTQLLKMDQRFLEWSDVDKVIARAEAVLDPSDLFTGPLTGQIALFRQMRAIRNFIAHDSVEAKNSFDTMVRNQHAMVGMSAGGFLLAPNAGAAAYKLLIYFKLIGDAFDEMTRS